MDIRYQIDKKSTFKPCMACGGKVLAYDLRTDTRDIACAKEGCVNYGRWYHIEDWQKLRYNEEPITPKIPTGQLIIHVRENGKLKKRLEKCKTGIEKWKIILEGYLRYYPVDAEKEGKYHIAIVSYWGDEHKSNSVYYIDEYPHPLVELFNKMQVIFTKQDIDGHIVMKGGIPAHIDESGVERSW